MVKIDKIYIDAAVCESEVSRRILARLKGVPRDEVHDAYSFQDKIRDLSLSAGKRILWLTSFDGPLVKPCPGTAESYLCCRYWIINAQTNCPLDCSYCILQGYLNQPVITVYVNIDQVFQEIDRILASEPHRLFRFGTGELTDSFVLDPLTGYNEYLIENAQSRNMILELKTKTAEVEHLPVLSRRNIVLAWSLNPREVISREEFKTASISERLKAAKEVLKKGYRLAFHFDPILSFQDSEKSYAEMIRALVEAVPEEAIAWISLGSLRFPSSLKNIIEERFPKSSITSGELIKGMDGKYRYFRPLRVQLYKNVYDRLRMHWKSPWVYFCMENAAVWQDVMGMAPEDNAHLDFLFHESLAKRFPDLGLKYPDRNDYPNPSAIKGDKR
ncbi:MAG: hypothetical protein JW893_06955 [Candidatus Omnitrophica bacterium]|nr:hypothetical protein [Candidatus Omnitrophota bacterium]